MKRSNKGLQIGFWSVAVMVAMFSATAWVGGQSEVGKYTTLTIIGVALIRPALSLVRMMTRDVARAVQRSYVKNTKGHDVMMLDRLVR